MEEQLDQVLSSGSVAMVGIAPLWAPESISSVSRSAPSAVASARRQAGVSALRDRHRHERRDTPPVPPEP
ncbi:hypothetical protein ACFFRZ_31805, partial [Nonomuraea rubra]|uniref:hypothetical protein n=1 Tax=Nonomuraea rubra TaxID=46180 RepID=UPI0035ED4038